MDIIHPEDYFDEHPEEEDEFVEEMIRLHANDEVIDYPEYWVTKEWLEYA